MGDAGALSVDRSGCFVPSPNLRVGFKRSSEATAITKVTSRTRHREKRPLPPNRQGRATKFLCVGAQR